MKGLALQGVTNTSHRVHALWAPTDMARAGPPPACSEAGGTLSGAPGHRPCETRASLTGQRSIPIIGFIKLKYLVYLKHLVCHHSWQRAKIPGIKNLNMFLP